MASERAARGSRLLRNAPTQETSVKLIPLISAAALLSTLAAAPHAQEAAGAAAPDSTPTTEADRRLAEDITSMVLGRQIGPAARSSGGKPVARLTPQEAVDWSGRGDASWSEGYATGMIRGIGKTIVMLSDYRLIPAAVCLPPGTSNAAFTARVRDRMRYSTIPRFGGSQDNWDEDVVFHVVVAVLESYPCR